MRSPILHALAACALVAGLFLGSASSLAAERLIRHDGRPNVVFILADDLGSADLGCYGQKRIRTPALDRLAAEGLRFTQFYAGSAVCAPSRCTLMTGRHSGRAYVRDNRDEAGPGGDPGNTPLPGDQVLLPELFQAQGYATAAIGKWGLGAPGSAGAATRQGFDHFFGYYCQRHAHNHYPSFLWRDETKVPLDGNSDGRTGRQYSHDLFEAEALRFLEDNQARPFFLYLPFTIPHLALQVPEDSLTDYAGQWDDPPYGGEHGYQRHEHPRAAYAAMVTRMDRTVGRVLDKLQALGLDDDTLVIFTSDNGPAHEKAGGADSKFFESAGALRGFKGSLYEGGIRTPFLARWPGRVPAGATCASPLAFYDVLPTLCDVARLDAPKGLDGVSFADALMGRGEPPSREYLYWEFPGYGGQQALRLGDWKAIRTGMNRGATMLELYDLAGDPSETTNVAAAHPDVVARCEELMKGAHEPSPLFPLRPIDATPK